MWAKMSRAGFFLLSLSLSPLLVLLIIAPTTRLDLPTVLIFNLLPIPFIAIGGLLLEKRDPYPFVTASIFIPFASLLITLSSGIFQIVGTVIVASLLFNIFTYELGHETSYREGYYIAILSTLALNMHSGVFLVPLGGAILILMMTAKFGAQVETVIFNGLFAVITCWFVSLYSLWNFCNVAVVIALLYSSLGLAIMRRHRVIITKTEVMPKGDCG